MIRFGTPLKRWSVLLLALYLSTIGAFYPVLAESDEDRQKQWYYKRFDDDRDDDDDWDSKRQRPDLAPVNNPTYAERCGECHFTYQPELLPSGSWKKILSGLGDHFGESIELEPESGKVISHYLSSNAAEISTAKLSRKIMRSLGDTTPLRIRDVPYIRQEHDEIPLSVIERDSIGSMSNCSACHRRAEKGVYEDDDVVIPK